MLDVVDFYRNDITALRELGFEVTTATTLRELPSDADLYFTWWWGSGALSLLQSIPRGRPNIFTGTLQLTPHLDWWTNLGALRRAIVRACVKLSTANVGICSVEMEYLRSLGGKNLHLVYQGIDTELYSPRSEGQRSKTIVTVSHLTRANAKRKCLETVIRAIPLVIAREPDARFVMIGAREDAFPQLSALATELGVQDALSFPGRVTLDEKLAAYRGAAMLAQATIYEGFGVSIAEAMSCGLPVVTSARGAVSEVVGACGRFVEPEDHSAMAREILALLATPEEAALLGARGRARIVDRFSYQAHRSALAGVLRTVLPGWTPPVGLS